MSKIALMWAPQIDLTRLVLLWVTIATLTLGMMLLLGMRDVEALVPISYGVMKGEFHGWRPDRIYQLRDGRRFRQIGVPAAALEETADYDPAVTIYRCASRWYLGIDESGDLTEVSPVREEVREENRR